MVFAEEDVVDYVATVGDDEGVVVGGLEAADFFRWGKRVGGWGWGWDGESG